MTKLKITASTTISPAVELFAAERKRQVVEEGFSTASDLTVNANGELALAAVCYALPPKSAIIDRMDVLERIWPWSVGWWKPSISDRKREIVKAGGLLIAEWDLLDAVEKANK